MTIEENIGYSFSDKSLLERALTRKAYANEQKEECANQEAFCTLGDAVLSTVLIDLLIQKGLGTSDEVTRKRKALVRKETLANISRDLNIGSYIKLGKGEEKQRAQEETKVLAETFEALIGSIYLDGGYETSKKTIADLFKTKISLK